MMSGIGSKGFTLVEVMIATAVLALGAVLIYEAFFSSLDAFNYSSDYLNTAPWLDEKIWQTQNDLNRFGSSAQIRREGRFMNRNKNFDWNLSYSLIDGNGAQDLYEVNLILFWQESKRKIRISRNAYAVYEEK